MTDLGGNTVTVPYWSPLVTAILGFASGAILEWARDARAHKREREAQASTRDREREARDAARRDQRFKWRTDFQRETLLNLQEEAFKLMRTASEAHHHDVMALRAGVPWHKQLYPLDLSDRHFSAAVQTKKLQVRVADEGVRKLVDELKELSGSVLFSRNEEVGEQASAKMALAYDELNDRIGELLRKLEDDEDTYPS